MFPLFVLCVCLEFFVPLENFWLIWRRHNYRWRVAHFDLCSALIAIEQWGFLACHTYCDTGHSFIMVISEDPCHSHHLMPSVWLWSCHYLFNYLCLSRLGIQDPTFREGNTLTECATVAVIEKETQLKMYGWS